MGEAPRRAADRGTAHMGPEGACGPMRGTPEPGKGQTSAPPWPQGNIVAWTSGMAWGRPQGEAAGGAHATEGGEGNAKRGVPADWRVRTGDADPRRRAVAGDATMRSASASARGGAEGGEGQPADGSGAGANTRAGRQRDRRARPDLTQPTGESGPAGCPAPRTRTRALPAKPTTLWPGRLAPLPPFLPQLGTHATAPRRRPAARPAPADPAGYPSAAFPHRGGAGDGTGSA